MEFYLLFSPFHPSLLCVQASFMSCLGIDLYSESTGKSTEGLAGMLTGMFGFESAAGVMPGVKVSDITFGGVAVRVYEPPAGGEGHLRRGLMYFHGGGWALCSASEYRLPAVFSVLVAHCAYYFSLLYSFVLYFK